IYVSFKVVYSYKRFIVFPGDGSCKSQSDKKGRTKTGTAGHGYQVDLFVKIFYSRFFQSKFKNRPYVFIIFSLVNIWHDPANFRMNFNWRRDDVRQNSDFTTLNFNNRYGGFVTRCLDSEYFHNDLFYHFADFYQHYALNDRY